jgi:hypothetical protein
MSGLEHMFRLNMQIKLPIDQGAREFGSHAGQNLLHTYKFSVYQPRKQPDYDAYLELSLGEDVERIHGQGLGKDLEFVRALAKIKGLENAVMKAHYVSSWLAYLDEKMGLQVWVVCGQGHVERDLSKGYLNEVKFERLVREMNQKNLGLSMKDQQGIEELVS